MISKRGRPSKVQIDDIINAILVHKNRIILSDKIISKYDTVWSEISVALGNRITPVSLYTMVSCNRYGLRDKLVDQHMTSTDNMDVTDNLNISDSINNESSDLNISNSLNNESSVSKNVEPINFTITVSRQEFEELIVFKSYKRMQRNKLRSRIWKILRPGIWEEFITSKIWDSIQLKCGFRFRNHYLSNIGTSGYINGKYL